MRLTILHLLLPAVFASQFLVAGDTFINPITEGADPYVIKREGKYFWCQSHGNRGIDLWVSDRLNSLGTRHLVWKAPVSGPYSKEVWAPEVHFLDGRWHLYFAASDGDNANHLAYVARSEGSEPFGGYTVHGPFATGKGADGKSPNVWAIDMTVLELGGKRYAVWSGWDAPGTDRQYLYIAPMKSPIELAGPRVLLCDNDDYLWERTEEHADSRGLHEGPQILQQDGRTFLIYSCGASWLPTYKLGMLELTGENPLDPSAWEKHPEPVFRSNEKTFGVGHGCYVKSPDDLEWWHVYHAKRAREVGWQRSIFIQPFRFGEEGRPDFGSPVAPGKPLPLPSGTPNPSVELPFQSSLRSDRDLTGFSYFGHQQFMRAGKDGIHLGVKPEAPVNDYRAGEKLLLDDADFDDFDASVQVRFIDGDRDAGMLFRVTVPSIGFDAQCGYFAGILPRDKAVVLGRTDGKHWTEIARGSVDLAKNGNATLRVRAKGPRIEVSVNGERIVSTEDDVWKRGSVGLRVVDTHARFSDFKVSGYSQQ